MRWRKNGQDRHILKWNKIYPSSTYGLNLYHNMDLVNPWSKTFINAQWISANFLVDQAS